jgi:phosphoribosyl-ATP pyrophosphohydrolase/phosphoribosyl-AMP cyclohydrolase/histidinol dehydrogenase
MLARLKQEDKTVETLAAVEGLEAHKRAVSIRVAHMKKSQS